MSVFAKIGRLGAQAILPALVLLGAFAATQALIAAGDDGPAARRGAGSREAVYAVRAEDVALGENHATFRAFGEVMAVGAAELRVASPGEVVAVHTDLAEGAIVDAGDTLVTIDPFAYEGAVRQAKAELAEARARKDEVAARISLEANGVLAAADQLDIAQRDLDRALQLARSGSITQKAIDDRRLLVSQRQQTLDQRAFTQEAEEARLAQMDAVVERLEWQVELAERALEDTILKAPYRAIVRAENAEVGRLLATNDIAVTVIRADALDVAFVLSDQRYGRLRAGGPVAGKPVEVLWRIGDQPVSLPGTITRTAADIASNTGGVRLFARIALPAAATERPIPRPGAFVEVHVDGPDHPDTVRLPATALYDGDAVFVIDDESRMARRTVRLAARDGDDVILAGQLSDGDAVVTTRLAEAGDGIKVTRVGSEPPAPPALAANQRPDAAAPPAPSAATPPAPSAPTPPAPSAPTPPAPSAPSAPSADAKPPRTAPAEARAEPPAASPAPKPAKPAPSARRRTRRGPPAANAPSTKGQAG